MPVGWPPGRAGLGEEMARVAPAVHQLPRPHSSTSVGQSGGYDSQTLKPGRWGVAKREAVLSWDLRNPMPEFRQVVEDGGIMWLDLSASELLLGGRLENVFIVSHRWSVHSTHTSSYARTQTTAVCFVCFTIHFSLPRLYSSCSPTPVPPPPPKVREGPPGLGP